MRLVDLLGGLSMVADYGFGLPPGTAVRSCLVAAALARRLNLADDDVRDSFYAALLMHIGCVGVAHERRPPSATTWRSTARWRTPTSPTPRTSSAPSCHA